MTEHEHIRLPQGSIEKTTTTLNLGPRHPATHGVFQNILELDGERIVSAEQTVGYIHRAFEKLAERRPLYQITPLTDRWILCQKLFQLLESDIIKISFKSTNTSYVGC